MTAPAMDQPGLFEDLDALGLFEHPRWGRVDRATADVLELMDIDPVHQADRVLITRAVVQTGIATAGRLVDLNDVRTRLVDERGEYVVQPVTVGPTIAKLKRVGVLVDTGRYVVTTGSAHGNNGKPQRLYRLDESRVACLGGDL